jgi:uncharacterized protein YyaL (SSP411 family)
VESPFSLPERLRALDFDLSKPSRLVLTDGEGREAMLNAAWSGWRRNLVVIGNAGPLDEFTLGLGSKDGQSTAYLCVGQACRPPVTDAAAVRGFLSPAAREVPGPEKAGD